MMIIPRFILNNELVNQKMFYKFSNVERIVMEKIVVAYWYKYFYDITGIEHNTTYEYSKEKRNEIIDLVLDKGLNIMLQKLDKTLVMWIDNQRFTQR